DGIREDDLRLIHKVLDEGAFLPADVVALARWAAEYYAAGVGETILAVLPPMTRGDREDAHKTIRVAAITAAGRDAMAAAEGTAAKSAVQRRLLERLAVAGTGVSSPHLVAEGFRLDVLARLTRAGLVSINRERVDRDPFEAGLLAVASGEA